MASHLFNLPTELLLMISAQLSAAERQLLRLTHPLFTSLLKPPTDYEVLRIERSVYNFRQHTACTSECNALYPDHKWKDWSGVGKMRDGNGSYFCGTCGGDVKVLCGEKVWWIWEVRDWEEERVVLRSLRESQGLGKAWWDVEDSEDGGEEKGEEVEGGEGAAEKVAGEADDEMVVDARLQEKSK